MTTEMDSTRFLFIVYILLIVEYGSEERSFKIVEKWTDAIGKELWDLTNAVARPSDIKLQYKTLNTKVMRKSGEDIIDTISENMGLMLKTKIDAVNCVRYAAEDIIETWEPVVDLNFTYTSSKLSTWDREIVKEKRNQSVTYSIMGLSKIDYFADIPINTTITAVHVPSNVHDLDEKVANDIMWSEYLEETFRNNYMRDPALSWQYFGSKNGILRLYPAMNWKHVLPVERPVDQYDCRMRSWFIEASTCSKDMVILIDNSGSMTGMGRTIAKTTMISVLQTLSNNDLVTVFNYSDTTDDLVACFKNKLVHATPENLEKFISVVPEMEPEGLANLTEAFTRAFSILKHYRTIRGCSEENHCNQIIMLITDGVPGNLTEVFKTWNWHENSTYIPVRVFTYLLGNEVTNVREIQWMACLNRGYYSHVHNQEEVREQVLKYIPVMARPLVLQSVENPVVWTHVYADLVNRDCSTNSTINTKCEKFKFITTVSVPVFDKQTYDPETGRTAHLLGVAGTDVNIKDMRRLTLSFKLGVNGYGFIVSNNGYVIMHPDLRATFDNRLKPNYNSVDLTEVEILYDGKGPRVHGENVLNLRKALVRHEKGNLLNVPVKLHYDDGRRVTVETRNYFYAPLPGTPFGLAIALPKYGRNIIQIGDEIGRNQRINITIAQFFDGPYWRVHPEWVYCRFHYLDYMPFDSPEDEVRYFVHMVDRPNWIWSKQYEHFTTKKENISKYSSCEVKTLERHDYYCDEELMQLLVFDAKVTKYTYDKKFRLDRFEDQQHLIKLYKIFVRFIATHSGLTRWQKITVPQMSDAMKNFEFGDAYKRTINEPWYKGAILQHIVDPDSLYITVTGEIGGDAIATVAISIFPKDGGLETPVSVAGYQMPIRAFSKRFQEIVSESSDPQLNCALDWFNCYLIDHNGYIVVSKTYNDTGSFFGILEGAIMQQLVEEKVYEAVVVYDYQAICIRTVTEGGALNILNPLVYIRKILSWTLLRITWYFLQFGYLPIVNSKVHIDEDAPDPPPPPKEVHYPYPCDKKRTLYVMDQKIASQIRSNSTFSCSRPFYSQRVVHTNLLFVAVNMLYSSCYARLEVAPVTIAPSEYVDYEADRTCLKFRSLNGLERRRPKECFTEHPQEHEITACGRASTQVLQIVLLPVAFLNVVRYII